MRTFIKQRVEAIQQGQTPVPLYTNQSESTDFGSTYLILHVIPTPCPRLLSEPLRSAESEYHLSKLNRRYFQCLETDDRSYQYTFDGYLSYSNSAYVLAYYSGVIESVSSGLFLVGRANNTVPIFNANLIQSTVESSIEKYLTFYWQHASQQEIILLMSIVGSNFCHYIDPRRNISPKPLRDKDLVFPAVIISKGKPYEVLDHWWKRLDQIGNLP